MNEDSKTYWGYSFVIVPDDSTFAIPVFANSVAESRTDFFPYASVTERLHRNGKKGVVLNVVEISRDDYEKLRPH